MMRRVLFYISLNIIFAFNLFAQSPIWSEIALEEDIHLEHLQTDTIGFVWCLSKEGFYKYDGLQLIQKLETISSSASYSSLGVDKDFNFLIGTSEGVLIKYNPYQEKIIKRNRKNENLPISFLDCKDCENECLILSYGNGVRWLSPGIDTFLTTNNILISNEVYAAISNDHKVILATDQGIQIIKKDEQRLTSKILNKANGLGDVIIPNLIEDEGFYWASNFDSQIYKIDALTLVIEIIDLPIKSKINGIKVFGDAELFVYTDTGIYTLNQEEWQKIYPLESNQNVLDITLDEENNIWACSANNILSKANLGFKLMPNSINKVQALLRHNESFWVGNSKGLFIIDGKIQRKISNKNVTCLKNFNEDILVGTFSSGILIFSKDGELKGEIDGWKNNPNQSVLYLCTFEDILYVSSLTGVLKMKIIEKDGKYNATEYQDLNELLGPGYVYQILKDKESLYLATDRQGMKIINGDSLYHITHFENGDVIRSIYSMAKSETGEVWFSTSTGFIGYVQENKVKHVESERFLRDPYTSLIATNDKKIVMVRNNSIDIYDPETNHFIYYDDLINSPDQNLYLNCFAQDNERIWLSKPNSILEIGKSQTRKIIPEVIINSVKVNLMDADRETIFKEKQNNFEFNYSAAWLTDPERITYQYKLEGLDENWRTTKDHSALYPILRPGDYTFRLRASKDGNFINDPEKQYQFTIKKPIYKTWWFLCLVLMSLIGIIVKWRDERRKVQLHKETQNKKRIEAQLISLQTQLNPHFLFNSFNTLIGLIEEDKDKSISFTEKLTDFYRSILELGKNDFIPLTDEVKLLQTYIHLLKERFGEQLNINLDFQDQLCYKIPPLTLQLLIENAVKHNVASSKDPLKIDVIQTRDKILVSNKIRLKYGNSKGTGIGLDNIMKRHTLNDLKPPIVEQNNNHFIVTIYLSPINL